MSATAEYRSLLVDCTPRVIRTKSEHERALSTIDRLMRLPKLTSAQRQLFDLLSVLVERYEEEADPTPDVPPCRVLAHLIESRRTTQIELARALGLPRSLVSEILSGRKRVTIRVAKKLGEYFGVSPSLFLEIDG